MNLAPGTIANGSTDAVNGGQLFTANQRIAAAFGGGSAVDPTSGQITAPTYMIQGATFNNAGAAFAAVDQRLTVNNASISTLQQGIANGTIGLVQQDATTRNITVGKYTDGTVVDFTGASGTRRLTGVSAGSIAAGSTDAVNGAQLFATNQQVATNTQQIATNAQQIATLQTQGSTYYKSNSTGAAASATGTNANAIGSGSSASGTNALSFGTGSQATQSGSIAIGANSSSTGANAIAIGTGASATGSVAVGVGAAAANGGAAYGDNSTATAANSTAIGPGSSATAANAVSVGSGSTNTVANTVSFGSAGSERRLTNVAAGISQTDAVNVGQLNGIATGFQGQITGLQSQITDNLMEARAGTAVALAASGLHYDNRPGKWSVAGSFGAYKGATGLAMGLGYAATDRLRFNAAFSGSPSQGSYGGTVGGSLTLN